MCPPLIMAIATVAAAVIPVVAKAIGDAEARGDYEEAIRLRREVAAKYGAVALPKLDEVLQRDLPPSAFATITENQSTVGTQEEMLRQVVAEAQNNGATPQSIAANNRAQMESGRYLSGVRGQIKQRMGERGMSGSGLDFALDAQASQAAANMFANNALEAEAKNADRASMARRAAGELSGQMRSQDWNVASAKARAQDEIAKWNENNRLGVAKYNNDTRQQQFDNEMRKRQASANAELGVASNLDASAARNQANANAYGSFGGAAAMGAGQAAAAGVQYGSEKDAALAKAALLLKQEQDGEYNY